MLNPWNLIGGLCKVLLAPTNLASAATTSAYQKVGDVDVLTLVILKSAGTAGEDPTIVVKQATDSSGTSAKNLEVRRAWVRAATDIKGSESTLTALATDETPADDFTDATWAEKQLMLIIEIRAQDLDRDNGFTHVAISIADVGTDAQWCSIFATGEKFYSKIPV